RRRTPTFVASAAQPRVELVLHRALDDQPRPQPRQFGQRLPWVLADPHGQQVLDLLFNLRRRRYGTSHGVGLLHRLPGPEGTYAVALTAPPALFTAPLRRDPAAGGRSRRHGCDRQLGRRLCDLARRLHARPHNRTTSCATRQPAETAGTG